MSRHTTLYDQDFDRWASSQVELLRQGKAKDLDIEHLIAELEDIGKSSLRELESRFIILMAHLLKWQYQLDTLAEQWQAFEGKSWRKTIIEQRAQLSFLLSKVPSVRPKSRISGGILVYVMLILSGFDCVVSDCRGGGRRNENSSHPLAMRDKPIPRTVLILSRNPD